MNNLPNTFLALIAVYKIEIPMIQRDYAQGRDDNKTNEMREHFIKEMLSHIEANKTLELDFIYGPIKNGMFIPVDGQQRLTTLFLLHWYLAKQADKYNDIIEDLKKFTYKVRTSTQDFLDALLDKNKGGNLKLKDSPKAEIVDAAWYYSLWNYDPSIQGMLNTLDTIYAEFKENTKNELWENLKGKNPIQFNLLNMANYNLSNELYLKMNARGLALSDFENFKAWLQGYCDEKIEDSNQKVIKEKYVDDNYFNHDDASSCTEKLQEQLEKRWTHKIDTTWTDLFWKLSDSNSDKFNKMFMNFFNSMAQIAIIKKPIKQPANNSASDNKEKSENEKLKKIKQFHDEIESNGYISFNDYDGCFTQEYLIDIFTFLDQLCDKEELLNLVIDFNAEDKKENIIQRFVNKHSYDDIVNFYAVFKYITNNKLQAFNADKTFHVDFTRWIRVIRNLVENTTISNANIINAIESVDILLKGCEDKNILQYLIDNENITIKPFTKAQVQEETFKAKLILSGENWESKIIEAENHGFFRGQIGFLLKDRSNDSDELDYIDNIQLEQFKNRYNNSISIFDSAGICDDYKKDALLLRAYISKIRIYSGDKWAKLLGIKYDLEKSTWKALLGNDEQLLPLVALLDISNGNLKSEIEGFLEKDSHWRDSNDDVVKYKVHEDLYKSKLLTQIVPGCLLHGWECSSLPGYKYVLYPYNAKASWKMYVIGTVRNDLLASLLESEIIKLKWNVKLDGISYFYGRSIIFIYEDKEFTWTENDDIIYDGKYYILKEEIKTETINKDELIDFLKRIS